RPRELPRNAGRAADARDRREGDLLRDRDDRRVPRVPAARPGERGRARRDPPRRRLRRAHGRHRHAPRAARPPGDGVDRARGPGAARGVQADGEPQHGPVRRASADGRVGRAARLPRGDDARLRRGRLPRGRTDHRRRAAGRRRRGGAARPHDGAVREAAPVSGVPRVHRLQRMSVTEVRHPLVQHKLSYLRDKDTPTVHFRKLVEEVTYLLTYEATKDFPTEDVEVETPLELAPFPRISGKKVAVCPILRAGLGMLDGVLDLISGARVGFIGLYRNEETLMPVEYYVKLPADVADRDVILLDPMLATGNSTSHAVQLVKDAGASSVRVIGIIAAPEGIANIERNHPDVQIVVAAIDRGLNEKGYIVPGLGDAGDRLYGTK